ncbi:MAG: hypothetical protein ACXWUG_06770 [Polyangiales bacterium]
MSATGAAGGFRGSALHHSIANFEKKYGPAAAHSVIARIPLQWRELVRPNAPSLGILGARIYPYPFVGDLVRTMRDVVSAKDEDVFVRELVYAGLDVLVGTMHRVLVRWLVTPSTFLSKRQEIWELYHDAGKLEVLSQTDKHFVIQDAEWSNREAIVCKINFEGRRRMLELMGMRGIDGRREKCRAWGHDTCETRFRWE